MFFTSGTPILLYRVMQGLVTIGTGYDSSMTADRASLPGRGVPISFLSDPIGD